MLRLLKTVFIALVVLAAVVAVARIALSLTGTDTPVTPPTQQLQAVATTPTPTVLPRSTESQPSTSPPMVPTTTHKHTLTLKDKERQHCNYTAANFAWWQHLGDSIGADPSIYTTACPGQSFEKLQAASTKATPSQSNDQAPSASASCGNSDIVSCPKGYKEGVTDSHSNPFGCNFHAGTAANPCEYKYKSDGVTPDLYSPAQKWAGAHLKFKE